MKALFASLRDPLYAASAGALLAVAIAAGAITFSSSDSNASGPPGTPPAATSTPAPKATPVPTASYGDILADTKRLFDLAEIRDALELFKQRNGSYPSTQGSFATVCAQALDAGCQLLSVARALPTTDGEHPYWFQSGGKSYTLFALVAIPPQERNCPDDVPAALTGNPVSCISGGQ